MNTYAVINIARQQLGLEDEDYRSLLVRVTGLASLRAMTERQRLEVVEALKKKGFKVRKGGKALPPSVKPYIRLIHALWSNCARSGVIENGSREALRAFCKRFIAPGDDRVSVDPDLLDYAQAAPIIEALKKMEARGKAKVPE